ncbi:MAG: DNA-processing protein DprA [Phycisphaerales bacterium]
MLPPVSTHAREMLRLTLVPGVGPILARRLIAHFGAVDRMLRASPADMQRVDGIGDKLAPRIVAGLRDSERLADRECELCERAGVRLIAVADPAYPPLLAETRDAPCVLYIRGDPAALSRAYTVAIVGSRHCTPYGIEQAERFASFLASSGLIVVSGGARGIDSAAHRAAIRAQSVGAGGGTVAVLGCGLANCYPPENAQLFQDIAGSGGAVVSELPMETGPNADNFPARNRVISALSLGVIVIEAPRGSGALITARCAIDEHGREVMAVPGRVDSPASEGSNQLIRKGEAALVTAPGDVLEQLEEPARHQWRGTHADRFEASDPTGISRADKRDGLLFGAAASAETTAGQDGPAPLPRAAPVPKPPAAKPAAALTPNQTALVNALASPMSFDELVRATGLAAGAIQADLTLLELRRVIRREGPKFARRTT